MTDQSPLLGLPYLQPAQAQKHVTHNEALRLLDVLVQMSVPDLGQPSPPATPQEGARYLVGTAATGDWAGQDHAVALFADGIWQFFPPAAGWLVWLRDRGTWATFDGAAWSEIALPAPDHFGINASADSQTRLAVGADAALFTHDGSDHRLKINKATAGDTASLLFQTGYSGRAEFGLAGSDDFAIKLSADGGQWRTALSFDAASAAVSGEAVQQDGDDATPGRLMLAQHGVLRSEILGTVAQSGGLPTGAIIERSTGAGGDVVKWADGTVMMTRTVTIDINDTAAQDFTYPQALSTVLGGSVIGADATEAAGSAQRRALADMAVWTDAAGWKVHLPDAVAVGTLDVTLSVIGLWF
jgi:hypothetical protein